MSKRSRKSFENTIVVLKRQLEEHEISLSESVTKEAIQYYKELIESYLRELKILENLAKVKPF